MLKLESFRSYIGQTHGSVAGGELRDSDIKDMRLVFDAIKEIDDTTGNEGKAGIIFSLFTAIWARS
jgi:hypothetical protein